jgi:hypothetical protein
MQRKLCSNHDKSNPIYMIPVSPYDMSLMVGWLCPKCAKFIPESSNIDLLAKFIDRDYYVNDDKRSGKNRK